MVKELIFLFLLSGLMGHVASAACRTNAPPPRAFALAQGSCPSGYYRSGGACVPRGDTFVLLLRALWGVVLVDIIGREQPVWPQPIIAAMPLSRREAAVPLAIIGPGSPAFRIES